MTARTLASAALTGPRVKYVVGPFAELLRGPRIQVHSFAFFLASDGPLGSGVAMPVGHPLKLVSGPPECCRCHLPLTERQLPSHGSVRTCTATS